MSKDRVKLTIVLELDADRMEGYEANQAAWFVLHNQTVLEHGELISANLEPKPTVIEEKPSELTASYFVNSANSRSAALDTYEAALEWGKQILLKHKQYGKHGFTIEKVYKLDK